MSVRQGLRGLRDISQVVFSPPNLQVPKFLIASGAAGGGVIYGCSELNEVLREPILIYNYPVFERPIHYVCNSARVISNAGWGAVVGGCAVFTAPISMPLYWWYTQQRPTLRKN